MFINYNKVSSLGKKKVDLFKKILSAAIPKHSETTVDDIIKEYSGDEEHFIVAKLAGNTVAGVIVFRVEGVEGFIDYIAVGKKYQQNGYGRLMTGYIFEKTPAQRVTLECGIESATFFEKIGFKVVDQFEDKKNNIKRFKFEKKVDKQTYF